MLTFRKLNNIGGWAAFFVALVTYTLSVEDTASFWDCGEFIAVSYKLMVPHPPGAPLFLLIGRMFSFLALGDVTRVAFWINMISVISSALSILFLFWSISFLGRKILKKTAEELNTGDSFSILGASFVGAMAYTFSDSFWFSAAEAEVYGMSSFFTAVVVWAMLKWDTITDPQRENKWMVLIAYIVGLSIGVHLLNLVTIPALGLVYYFKKEKNTTIFGAAKALFISLVIVGIINTGIIPGLPSIAGQFEIWFVNGMGLPFGSGAVFFTFLLIGSLVYGLIYSVKNKKVLLNTALVSLAFILIGYASYGIVLIRSNFDPPIDENDPENIMSFVSYLKREQYGSRPLLYGRTFMSERTRDGITQGEAIYGKGEKEYEILDHKTEVDYEDEVLLPRMYSNSGNHPALYRQWSGLKEGQKPNLIHNLRFMFKYQIGHMYLRYFMWNFAGRDGDDKEADWLSPFSSSVTELPEALARNKAYDNYYMLPFLLGMIGLIFQLTRDEKSFAVTGMLFILTGVAIVVYLNSPPVEPRERDYIYVGSFYAFAIWMGLGVMAISELLRKILKSETARPALATAVCLLIPAMMGIKGWDNHNRTGRFHSVDQAKNTLSSCAPNAILFTGGDNDTFPLWYVQDVEGFRTDVRVVVLSYFSTDWYVEQMKRKVYESEPLPISFEWNQYKSGKNDYLPLIENDAVANRGINLTEYLRLVKAESPGLQVPLQGGSTTTLLPSKHFILPLDSVKMRELDFIPAGKKDRIRSRMEFSLVEDAGALYKSDLMILDMMANFDWKRPIYFNNTSANTTNVDLRAYMQVEGMAYRLVPFRNESGEEEVNKEVMYKNMKDFAYRGFDNPNTYHDDEYKKFGANLRSLHLRLAEAFYLDGEDEKAKEVLNWVMEKVPDSTIPYDYYMPEFVRMYHLLGEHKRAKELDEVIGKRAVDMLNYLSKKNIQSQARAMDRRMSTATIAQLRRNYRMAEERARALEDLEVAALQGSDSSLSAQKPSELRAYYLERYKYYDEILQALVGPGIDY